MEVAPVEPEATPMEPGEAPVEPEAPPAEPRAAPMMSGADPVQWTRAPVLQRLLEPCLAPNLVRRFAQFMEAWFDPT